MNWQPIETAPKDGTEILISTPGGLSDHFYVVYWDENDEDGRPPAWYSRDGGCDGLVLTEKHLKDCFIRPMWCELEPQPGSLCYSYWRQARDKLAGE